jgi:hypothetical protein
MLRPPLRDLVSPCNPPVPDPQLPEAVVDDRLTAEQRREGCRRLHGTSERARHKPVHRILSKDVGDRRGGPHPSRLDALVEPTHRPALAVRGRPAVADQVDACHPSLLSVARACCSASPDDSRSRRLRSTNSPRRDWRNDWREAGDTIMGRVSAFVPERCGKRARASIRSDADFGSGAGSADRRSAAARPSAVALPWVRQRTAMRQVHGPRPRPRKRDRQLGQDRQVGMKPDPIQPTNQQRQHRPLMLEPSKLALDGAPRAVQLPTPLRCARNRGVQVVGLDPHERRLALARKASPLRRSRLPPARSPRRSCRHVIRWALTALRPRWLPPHAAQEEGTAGPHRQTS